MRKNGGFTLIELLAVIVILAIISLITVPIVVGIMDRVRINSYKESVRSIFEATNIYLASKDFQKFPSEGINVTNVAIKLKNKNFTSGKIILNENGKLEVDKVSNGKYCAGGTLEEIVIIEGSCDQLDVTPPTIILTSNLVTSSSITVVAVGEDLESGINGYEFSKDNGLTWTSKQTSNVYTFDNLTSNTDHTFRVRAINNNQLNSISDSIIVRTDNIPIPIYSINTTDWVASAIVTITYPARESVYIYQYSFDSGLTWLTVDAPAISKDITFNDNGSVIARILDGTNEVSGAVYTVTNIDEIDPIVSFSMNGNSTYAKSRSTNVTVSDNYSGVLASSLKYQWATSTTTPTEESFTTTFTSSGAISTPAGITGGYYLWVLGKDNAENTVIIRSDVFNLDNTVPVITLNTTPVTIGLGSTYIDTGVTASDNIDGDITASIIKTGTVNTSIVGSYTVTYNVSDTSGNDAVSKVKTVNVIQVVASFNYTGAQQSYTIPVTGKYKLEVWGAQGGVSGGKGGYSTGERNLNANNIIYIYVGQQGSTSNNRAYNGGGRSGNQSVGDAGGGGGATDMRTVGGLWNNASGLSSRIIVAGGGGGGATTYGCNGGVGGGPSGFKPTMGYSGELERAGSGGTQSAGGLGSKEAYPGNNGTFGVGGDCYDVHGAGAGGGGYYGGGAGAHAGGGGGGSGYIGGVTNGQNLAGNQTFNAPGGGTVTGHTGNGYARITFISE